MPEYLHPGVYMEETSYRGKPIQGVSTSTAGFVGAAAKGPEGKPSFVGSYAQYRRIFGDPPRTVPGLGDFMGHSVKAFFDNGGARCYVVRALAADAANAQVAVEQGIALRLVPGGMVRGPARTLRLNALRGVRPGSVLNVFTRPDASGTFTPNRTLTVETIDPARNSITVVPASEIPGGVTLSPDNTVILIAGLAPAALLPAGGGATFTARHRGVDGDRIAVEIRPRDRPPVALTTRSVARRNPALALAGVAGPAAGDVTVQMDANSLRRLRVGDTLRIGASAGLVVQAIANGDVTFDVVGGGPGADHSGGATMALIERGSVLATPFALGAAAPAFAIDLTGGGPFGPSALPHGLVSLLRAGDVVRLDSGGVTTDVAVTALRTAQEIAAGAHVTLAAPGMTTAEAVAAPAELTATSVLDAGFARLFLGDVSGFEAPVQAGGPAGVSISDGTARDAAVVLLVDPASNVLYVDRAVYPGAVTPQTWTTVENLVVAADGAVSLRVASTGSFYTGAKVELDTGTDKIEMTVEAVDTAARTVRFTAPLAIPGGGTVEVGPDPASRNVFLRSCEIDVVVHENGTVAEVFEGLTWNPDAATDAGLRHYVSRINDEEVGSALVRVTPPAVAGLGFANAPVNATGQPAPLTGGSNGSALTDLDLIGADNGPGRRTGIQALSERDDISMVAVPGVTVETVQAALITHCELLRYRMAVLDSPAAAAEVTAIQAHRNNYDSKYAAYYAPWLKAQNSQSGRIETFPPSGYAMGIYARSDNTVGVHKAPANEVVRNITDVALPLTAAEQDVLNPIGVNLIRDLTPRGIRVWGARTISSDQEWKYVNFRRLFIYLEHSIDLGTQWVVFEPNSEALWSKVVETVTSFLIGVWKSGALMGTTPEQAFFVRCDRTTMTQDDIDNGRLICQIGIAPVAPAEFVIFRIGQATLTE